MQKAMLWRRDLKRTMWYVGRWGSRILPPNFPVVLSFALHEQLLSVGDRSLNGLDKPAVFAIPAELASSKADSVVVIVYRPKVSAREPGEVIFAFLSTFVIPISQVDELVKETMSSQPATAVTEEAGDDDDNGANELDGDSQKQIKADAEDEKTTLPESVVSTPVTSPSQHEQTHKGIEPEITKQGESLPADDGNNVAGVSVAGSDSSGSGGSFNYALMLLVVALVVVCDRKWGRQRHTHARGIFH